MFPLNLRSAYGLVCICFLQMKGNGKASPKAAPAPNEGNRQAKGQQQKVEKKPAPVINKPALSTPQQMKKPEPEKKEKIESKFEDVQRRDQQAAQRKKVVSAPAPVSSLPVQTLATQLAGMRLGVVEYVDIPEALEEWATHKLDECNAILAQVGKLLISLILLLLSGVCL